MPAAVLSKGEMARSLIGKCPHPRLLAKVVTGSFAEEPGKTPELFAFTGEKAGRPGTFPDPRRASETTLKGTILPYFFRSGWIGDLEPLEFQWLLDTRSVPELRELAVAILKEHPWPADFTVPSLVEFITSPLYLNEAIPTERQVRFQEALGESAWEWFVHRRTINLVALCWGKGSGKDWLSACILSYVAYTVGHMLNPWFNFDQIQGESLDCINVAETGDLAAGVFFEKLRRMLLRPCFKEILDQREGKDIATEKVVFRRTVEDSAQPITCMRLLSLNSRSEAVEGKNTFFWVMDEADAFKTKANGPANAREMFTKLSTSNRFGSRQIGIVISYPRAKNGFIIPLLKACGNRGGPMTNAWGDLAPTWEVLPWKTFIPMDGREEAPVYGRVMTHTYTNPAETINHEPDTIMMAFYRDAPDDFRSVYACDPPATEDAFIVFPDKIGEAVKAGQQALLKPVAKVRPYTATALAGGVTHRFVAKAIDRLVLRPGVQYFAGGDAGARQDSFTLCISHAVLPNESGALCPACWLDPLRRRSKHYVVEDITGAFLAKAIGFPCDGCGALPGEHSDFWGVSRPSGRVFERPVIDGYSPQGSPRFVTEEFWDPATGARSERQKMEQVFLPLIVEDLLLEWEPDKNQGLTVDFESVTEVILAFHKTGQLAKCRFDAWQAEEKLQRLLKAGLATDTKQLSNPEQSRMYRNYKDLLYSGLVWLLPNEKRDRQLEELHQDSGGKIDHPQTSADGSRGGKDLTDAEAISFLLASEMSSRKGFILTGKTDGMDANRQREGRRQRETQQARGSIVGGELAKLGIRGRR